LDGGKIREQRWIVDYPTLDSRQGASWDFRVDMYTGYLQIEVVKSGGGILCLREI
jgi:hypothetical protein